MIAAEVLDNPENGPTYFSSNLRQMLGFLRDENRRAAVGQLADVTRAFFAREVNRAPHDPGASLK
jgi:hypothetical protein